MKGHELPGPKQRAPLKLDPNQDPSTMNSFDRAAYYSSGNYTQQLMKSQQMLDQDDKDIIDKFGYNRANYAMGRKLDSGMPNMLPRIQSDRHSPLTHKTGSAHCHPDINPDGTINKDAFPKRRCPDGKSVKGNKKKIDPKKIKL